MRFRVVLFLALSGVTVLPVLALAGWIYVHAQEREAQIVKDTHLLLARNLGGALQRYARDVKSSFKLAAEAALLGDPTARRSVLNLMNDMNYVHLCVADFETGFVNAGLFPKEFPCPPKVPGPRFETFKNLVEGEEPIFSPVMANPRGEPTIYVLMRRMGQLVIGAISTQYFVERGSAIAFGELGHAAIVDQTGTVLAHPRPDWLAEMKNIAQVRPVAAMLRGETGTTTFFSPALEADMVAGYTTVPATGWGVMIPQPEDEVRESAGNVQKWALVITAIGILASAVLSWFLAGLLSRGLGAVTEAAIRMSAGDLSARATQPSGFRPLEVVELSTAFNAMGEAIDLGNQKLFDALEAAREAAQAKTTFLTMITHEIRTPMNGVLGVVEMLRSTRLDKEQTEMVELINRSAFSLIGMVNDVLDISKIEAGEMEIDLGPVDLRALTEEVVEELQTAAVTKGLILTVDALDDAPAMIPSDETKLRQILVNLVGNAIKFTDSGFVRVAIRTSGASGSRRLIVSVQDTGIGIEQSALSRLFEPFSQADPSTTRKYGGTGLGLSICRRLADLLGGVISIDSRVGEGSTFRLELPYEPNEQDGTSSDPGGHSSAQPRDRSGELDWDSTEIAGGRVLVAEDHSTNMWILRRQLENMGFEVDGYENGIGALSAYKQGDYALVITDYLMPDVDGIGLTRSIRSMEQQTGRSRIPILGLTANAFQDALDQCRAAGMDEILTKPVDRAKLSRAIAKLLRPDADLVDLEIRNQTVGKEPTPSVLEVTGGLSDPDAPSPIFDRGPLGELFGKTPEEGRAWLRDYVDALDGRLSDLSAAIEGPVQDRKAAIGALHAISGVSHAAGARVLGQLTRNLHDTLFADDRANLSQADLAAVTEQANSAKQAIERYINEG